MKNKNPLLFFKTENDIVLKSLPRPVVLYLLNIQYYKAQ